MKEIGEFSISYCSWVLYYDIGLLARTNTALNTHKSAEQRILAFILKTRPMIFLLTLIAAHYKMKYHIQIFWSDYLEERWGLLLSFLLITQIISKYVYKFSFETSKHVLIFYLTSWNKENYFLALPNSEMCKLEDAPNFWEKLMFYLKKKERAIDWQLYVYESRGDILSFKYIK